MAQSDSSASLEDLERQVEADPTRAADETRRLLRSDPLNAQGYRLLAKALRACSPPETGVVATVNASSPALLRAAQALRSDDLETAEVILRGMLLERPDDVEAIQLLADFASRLAYEDEAEALLRLAMEQAPSSIGPKIRLASALYRRNRPEEVIDIVEGVLSNDPANFDALNLKAAALARAGRLQESARHYEESLRSRPEQPQVWSRYGQALRSLGRADESVAAIRRGIEMSPRSGELWWSLSDLKSHRFDQADVDRMQRAIAGSAPNSGDRMYFHFALAKALEDAGDYQGAFAHYAEGNRLQQPDRRYDPDEASGYVEAARKTFSEQFFAERDGWGAGASDPIFIVGMPRSGSTLLEQILGSHPEIEATMELPDMVQLGEGMASDLRDLPLNLERATEAEVKALGSSYMERTRRYRKTSKLLFVDKMPNNWLYVPLIQLALPNAKIIDIRRHPLDCCVSNFKQLFLTRQGFSNDLTWLGRYYRDYVELMRHFDEVLPGRVHRLVYERLVEDSEGEVRRLLNYVGVPFNPACLRHHEGERVILTASADQVRRPINPDGVGSWRVYDPWLNPLKEALGPALIE